MKRSFGLILTMLLMALIISACGNKEKEEPIAKKEEETVKPDAEIAVDKSKEEDTDVNNNGEKVPTKDDGKDTETSTDSNAVVGKNDKNTNEKVDKPVNVSNKKEVATPANETLKEKYLKILNDTQVKADNIVPVDSTTLSLNQAEGERYDLWDRLLNEVYGVLKRQLSAKEMDQLKIKQREWIIYRDNKAKEASLVNKGGTAEQLAYLGELATQTEIRCYTLVNDYMK